eukprot:Rhum_TRINITY_DN1379_c0_g1::Rhum_TRINITY_DN1379_c0_g1_i1::g.3954::m.3954
MFRAVARQAAGRPALTLERQQRFMAIKQRLQKKQQNPLRALKTNGFYANTSNHADHAQIISDRALPSHAGRNVGNMTAEKLTRKTEVAPDYAILGRLPGQELRSAQQVDRRERAREIRALKVQKAHLNLQRAQGFKDRPEDAWRPGDVNWSKKSRRYKPMQQEDEFEEVAQASRRASRDASEEGRRVPKSMSGALTRDWEADEDEEVGDWNSPERYHVPHKATIDRAHHVVHFTSGRVQNPISAQIAVDAHHSEHRRRLKNLPDALKPAPYESGPQHLVRSKQSPLRKVKGNLQRSRTFMPHEIPDGRVSSFTAIGW